MKKPRPKKIRKVWAIKPKTRVQTSRKRELMDKVARRELKGPDRSDL